MKLTTQECVLTHLLNCGICDLSMLDDINYDLDEILDHLVETNNLSLNSLLGEVFERGIGKLREVVENEIKNIRNDLTYLLDKVPSKECNEKIIQRKENDLTINDVDLLKQYGGFEWKEDIGQCLIELEKLNPDYDIEYHTNRQDSGIYFIKNEDTYRRLFCNEIEEIESDMGFCF